MLSSDVLNINFLPSFSLTIEVIKVSGGRFISLIFRLKYLTIEVIKVSAGRFISLIFRLKYLAITLRASSDYGCPATRLR